MMSHLMQYTEEEQQAIDELKKRTFNDLTPILQKDETFYYRFLKARNFNLKNAELLIRKHLSDRKMYDIERAALQNFHPPEHMYKYIPNSIIGWDKTGHLVRYVDAGNWDFKGMVHLYDFRLMCHFVANYFEKDMESLVEQSKKLGKPITTYSLVFNMDKFSLFQATYKKALDYAFVGFKLYQDNYPERIKDIYVINASMYFNIAFAVVKNILAADLLKKIHIYGKTGWQEVLLDVIDADVLPAFLGGNRTDPDGNPLCNSFIVHGKPIPEELYKNKKRVSMSPEGAKSLTLPRSSSCQIKVLVENNDSKIEWEFETNDKDIGFSLLYKSSSDNDDKTEELIPNRRIDTELSTETGVYVCTKPGIYIIVFDNSYSWLYSKTINYKIRLSKA